MEELIYTVIVNILYSGAFLTIIITGFRKIWKAIRALMDDSRSRDKADICRIYRESIERGWLYDFELENAERLFDNYRALDGNHYVENVMKKLRNDFAVRNSEINLER